MQTAAFVFNKSGLLSWTFLILLFLPAAYSEQKGVAEGKLINGTDPSIAAGGVDLDVVGLGGGMSILKSSTTDSLGRFRIDGLPMDTPLMIRANYKTAGYHGRVSFDATGKADVEIEVFEPTASMKGIQVEGIRIAFQLVGDQVRSLETISFNNQTKPPRTFMSSDGNLRFSKPPGIIELPRIDITGPGTSMPLVQPPLESADGKSYYSLYPLRPGTTTFEIQQVMPYKDRRYIYRKKFFQDIGSFEIGVTPEDMVLSGPGLTKVQTDPQTKIAVYAGGPVKAGSELEWTLSGGTPGSGPETSETADQAIVKPMPNIVSQKALIIGPLLLAGFVIVLWYAFNHIQSNMPDAAESRTRALRERRDQLLNHLAGLDRKYENRSLAEREYLRRRGQGKRQLRRIALLMKK